MVVVCFFNVISMNDVVFDCFECVFQEVCFVNCIGMDGDLNISFIYNFYICFDSVWCCVLVFMKFKVDGVCFYLFD